MKHMTVVPIVLLLFYIITPARGSILTMHDDVGDVEINGWQTNSSKNWAPYADLVNLEVKEHNATHYQIKIEVDGNLEKFKPLLYDNFTVFRIYFSASVQWDCFIDSCKSIFSYFDIYFDGVNRSAVVSDNGETFLVDYSVLGGNITSFFPISNAWQDVFEERIKGGTYEKVIETYLKFESFSVKYGNVETIFEDHLPNLDYFLTRQQTQEETIPIPVTMIGISMTGLSYFRWSKMRRYS
ncbi:MAG: hypothetical protein D6732_18275 [Methanobacteriota archaeon]|nr:MAG: hypothetical protein D6732_18275 [Euryarchaeota archaeon]